MVENTFFGEDNVSVQTTLNIPLSKEKVKSLDNINYVNDNLNTYPSEYSFKEEGVEYTAIPIPISSKDYTFIYNRFSNCLGDTETLLKDFLKESVDNSIESMKDTSIFREEISLPEVTMEKINAMLYYYETIEGEYNPISLDDFIILMIDELYEIRKQSYKETGNKLSNIVEKVIP